ncbi:MAG: class I tRNA ligase family protein [Flavobacteriaceae bacterium]|nr:class I tRNA ligase family protein [Flavobacteriaceae bacterium]
MFFNEEGQFLVTEQPASKEALKVLHKTIKKIEDDLQEFSFNTTVSAFMIAVNELNALKCNQRQVLEPFVVMLSPFAPHICEELWEQLGHQNGISTVDFPHFDESYLVEDTKDYPVSFNGKMRFTITLSLDLDKSEIEKAVMEHPKTTQYLEGKSPKKVIVVPGKIVNLVC